MGIECTYSIYQSAFELHSSFLLVFQSLNTIIAILNVVSNSALLYGLFKTRQTRRMSTRLIFIMSLEDFIFGLLSQPLVTMALSEQFQRTCIVHIIAQITTTAWAYSSFCMVSVVAFDRYMHMRYLERYPVIMTKKKARKLVIICLAVPQAAATGTTIALVNHQFVVAKWIYMVMWTSCLLLTSTFYVKATLAVKNRISPLGDFPGRNMLGPCRIFSRVAKKIIICFFVVLSPFIFLTVIRLALNWFHVEKQVYIEFIFWISYMLGFSYAFINTIIVISCNKAVKKVLLKYVPCMESNNVQS